MHIPLWVLRRRGPLRGRTPYISDAIGGAETPATPAPAGAANRGFPPAPIQEAAPSATKDSASRVWVGRVVEIVNSLRQGKMNVVIPVTLTPDSTITAIVDSRIGFYSALLFTPLTANAAAEMANGTLYVGSQNNGSAVVSHADNAQADRNFNVVVLG